MQGRVVYKRNSAAGPLTSIDLSDMASGMYYIKVTTEKGEGVLKVVKEYWGLNLPLLP
jgi:hypothetical protein